MALSCTLKNRGVYVAWLIVLLCFIAENHSRPTFRRPFTVRRKMLPLCNSTECLKKQKEFKQMHRMLTIQQDISNALNRSKHADTSTMFRNLNETTATSSTNQKSKPPNTSLVLLQSLGTKQKNILKFNIHPDKGHTKILTAHLLVVIKRKLDKRQKKQKDKERQKKRNKRITIKVHEVNGTSGAETLIQTLKMRVKRTYMQKFKLPAELLQRYVDMEQSNVTSVNNLLQLRVTCQRCDKRIKPYLANRKKKRKQVRYLKNRSVLKPFIVLKQYTT